MNIQIRTEGKRGVLTLKGPLIQGSGGLLQEQVDDLLRQGVREFVLEIHGVPNVDSNGLGQLVQAYKTIKSEGAHLRIVGLTGRIQRMATLVNGEEWSGTTAAAELADPAASRERRSRTPVIWLALGVALIVVLMLVARLAGFGAV